MHRSIALQRAGRALRLLLALLIMPLLATLPSAADASSPLAISMSASANPVASGASLTYTITVVNTGGARMDEVALTDQINGMSGLILTSSVGSCSQSAQLITCAAGTLAGGQSWTVTIRGTVTAASGTTLNNTATVTGAKSSTTFTNAATVATLVSGASFGSAPELTLSFTAPASIAPSSPATYKLTVTNSGGVNASGVAVSATMPVGFSAVSASGTSLFACSVAGLSVSCSGGAVNAGADATITISATSSATAGKVTATAIVDPLNTIAESNDLNNAADATTVVAAPSPAGGTLTITKGFSTDVPGHPNQAIPGALLTYQIVVQNTSGDRADSVAVVDGTQGLDAASVIATASKGSCTVSAPTVTCTATSPTLRLDPGETLTITIVGRVVAAAGSFILNTATVTGNIRNVGVSSSSTASTIVKPGVDLTVTHASSPAPGSAAGGLTYTLVVGNSGLQSAAGVLVRVPLPPSILLPKPGGFESTPPGSCTIDAARVVSCALASLAAESIATISFSVVAPQQITSITTTATVDPLNTIAESDETNNTSTATATIETGVDLTVSQSVNFDPVAPSGTLIYTITVPNIGTQDTAGVVVRDTLPAGARFRSAAGDPLHNFTCAHDGAATGGVVTCVGGIIRGTYAAFPGIDAATITITLFAPAQPGLITNQVRVDPERSIPETNEDNNINTLTTDVQIGGGAAFNELTISLTDAPDPVAPSGVLIYTIIASNTGSDTAFNVRVRNALPAGAVFRSATSAAATSGSDGFVCAEAGGVVTCAGARLLGGGGTATITIEVFAPSQPGTYTNQAQIDPENAIAEADETNNAASTQTTVQIGGGGAFNELALSMSDAPDPVAPSGVLVYTLTAQNSGSGTAFNVKVRNALPAGAVFRSATSAAATSGSDGFTCSEAGGVVTCAGARLLGGGGTATIIIEVFAPSQPGVYTNQAVIDPDNTIAEADETNNAASVQTTVQIGGGSAFIDLTIESLTDTPDPVTPDGLLTYTLVARNLGAAQAFNVSVRDILPAGVTFVSASGSGDMLCSQAGGVVECGGATLAGGGAATVTIEVRAPARHAVTLLNQARIDPANTVAEANETNNSRSTTTLVQSNINLTVTKRGPSSASQNSSAAYVITVANTGSGLATGVRVVDPIPVGLIPLNVLTEPGTSNFACQVSQNPINLVDCLGDLPGGSSTTITVETFVAAETGTRLDNEAKVDPDNRIVETDDITDNSSTATTVVGVPDLSVRAIDLFDPVSVGQNQVYNVTVSNIGSAPAAGVTVRLPLPAGLSFVSASATNGFSCSQAGGLVTCGGALSAGAASTISLTAAVGASAANPIVLSASADPAAGEVATGNNQASVTTSLGASGVDLTIVAFTDTPDPAPVGGPLTYVVSAANVGTSPANNVRVRISLPASGVELVGVAGSDGFACTAATGTLTCLGALAGGASTTITAKFLVLPSASGALEAVATIDPDNTILESVETNNTAEAITTVTSSVCSSCVELVPTIIVTPPTATQGGALSYSVAVGNTGDTDVTAPDSVSVLVELPAGIDTADVIFSASNGFTCGYSTLLGPRVSCTGPLKASEGTIISIGVVVLAPSGSSLTATASVALQSASVAEFNPANNSVSATTAVVQQFRLFLPSIEIEPASASGGSFGRRYVAGGDHLPAGHTIAEAERYPSHLLADHLQARGWGLYNLAADETTSASYLSDGQLAATWNRQPDLITLSVGGEDPTIVDTITSCFDKIKDHDFSGATLCFGAVQANTAAWENLHGNLTSTLNGYNRIMAGRPWLVVAVVGYPNPYPQAADVAGPITALCAGVIDATISCAQRWAQLPPALLAADATIRRLNSTIDTAVEPFRVGSQGRFVFVNPYEQFKGHAMKMEVTLRLDQVCHLCGTQYQYFDMHISTQNLGSSQPWFKAGDAGTKSPDYLIPGPLISPPVVIQQKSQRTEGMGVHPNDAGNRCISDLIWEAVKWKLNVGEPADPNICT